MINDLQSKQVEWYRKNGRFPRRIRKDKDGKEYVIGDWSWNRKINRNDKCPHCGKLMSAAFEEIEEKMKKALAVNERGK